MGDAGRRKLVVTTLTLVGVCILVYGAGEPSLLKSAAAFAISAVMLLRAFILTRAKG